MRFRRARVAIVALVALIVGSCADGFSPLSNAPVVTALTARAIRVNAVRVSWPRVDDGNLASYVVERRVDLTGAFVQVAQLAAGDVDQVVWIDTDVQPETFYGYRVRTVTIVGDRSRASVIGGALTPPLPGIDVATASFVTVAAALDPDGYEVVISGPESHRAPIGVENTKRFSPLPNGTYTVALEGVISRCSTSPASQTIDVTDTTAATIALATFQITCRDPERGDIRVALDITGADLDPLVLIDVLGEASDVTLPPAERTYARQQSLSPGVRTATFTNLHPGTYDVSISGIASNCTLSGTPTRTVNVVRSGESAVTFAVNCTGSTPPIDPNRRFVLRNRFTPPAAPTGNASVLLISELDLTANPAWNVSGIQADYFYDPTVLRYDSTNVARMTNLTVNGLVPGKISVLAAAPPTSPRTGNVKLLEFAFTVIGATGQVAASNTQNFKATARINSANVAFADSVRIEEDTFTVGSGAGGNAPPIAEANGPYSGFAGATIAMTASGSTDSDGSIANYAWNFGDGTTGDGANVNKLYAAPGSYTVTLTVTDDDGATSADQATVTVAPSGGGNTPPIAEANGPYSGVTGVPITLSSSGSSDPGGSITSYSWNLGNGQTATGASPSVTFASAGTYTITLTVTDNGGLTATDQATVTVTAASGNLTFRSEFVPPLDANGWIQLALSIDLATNIPDTPGVEAIRTFVIDSLKWDPAKFQLMTVNLGPGITGSVNQSQAANGRLSFAGQVATANQSGDVFGVLRFATIRLKPIGASGASAVIQTFLGPLQGPASTNFFVYNSKIAVVDGSFILP